MTIYVGIDNGLGGGIVFIDEKQNIARQYIMPILVINGKKHYDTKEIVNIFKQDIWPDKKVCLEQAHTRPVSGKRACFMNGFGYGLMQGILESLNISYEIVTPQSWMKELEIPFGTEKGSIMFCKRKWPDYRWTATDKCKIPHTGLTDAAAMALYCWRKNHTIK